MMKINRKIIFIILIAPFLMGSNCNSPDESEDCHTRFYLENNSEITIRMTRSTTYPDSTILDGIGVTGNNIAKPGERIQQKYGECIEDRIFNVNEHGVLMVYIWNDSDFGKYSLEELRVNQMWLKKYDMSLEEFRRLNWTITYQE